MKQGYLALIAIGSLAACSVQTAPSSEDVETVQSASTSCSNLSTTQSNQRTAASVAMQLLRLAAPETSDINQVPAYSILASQRYRVQSSETGIEFDPTDNFYTGGYVTSAMEATLSIPQSQDANFAAFLSNGLKAAWANTNGTVYPALRAIGALVNYNGKGPSTVYVPDYTCGGYPNPHKVVLSTIGQACGSNVFKFAETVINSYQYAPLFGDSITDQWRSTPPAAFNTKGASLPTMPFNGTSGNPYLIISINGSAINWSNASSFAGESCFNLPNNTCTGSIEIDPVPYSEPGAQYDVNNNLLGSQGNPFVINSNLLLADASHAGQWATRSVNGVQQWGTFSQAITRGGVTFYSFVAKY